MLNLNYNIIGCKSNTIAPILTTTIEYMIVGGGGGANAGNGTNGGNGGGGGQFISSSFDITHLTSAAIVIGNGGNGGLIQSALGTNGQNSTITYNALAVATANGGTAGGGASGGTPGVNAGTAQNGTLWFLSPIIQYGPQGGGGAGSNASVATNGGGTGGGNGGDPATSATANSGGGGGGSNWNAFPAGSGGSGISILRYFNPNNIFDATGGTITTVGDYTYHTFTTNGTFTFLGKRDR